MTAAIQVVTTVTQLTDSKLVGLMLGGDKEAFAELYNRRQRDVYRFALHMSGAADLAEDVTQEVFMVLMRNGSSYDESIPAGKIGNERAIEIVDERWYSPDLQTMVMTRHSDPRSGETVYRLTNINRAEPDPSLFGVPTDYTLKEDEPVRFRTTRPDKPEQQ